MNSTCWDDEKFMPILEKLALRMRLGTYILTLTRTLPSVSKAEFHPEVNQDLDWEVIASV
jgi:hypothetical protein